MEPAFTIPIQTARTLPVKPVRRLDLDGLISFDESQSAIPVLVGKDHEQIAVEPVDQMEADLGAEFPVAPLGQVVPLEKGFGIGTGGEWHFDPRPPKVGGEDPFRKGDIVELVVSL